MFCDGNLSGGQLFDKSMGCDLDHLGLRRGAMWRGFCYNVFIEKISSAEPKVEEVGNGIKGEIPSGDYIGIITLFYPGSGAGDGKGTGKCAVFSGGTAVLEK